MRFLSFACLAMLLVLGCKDEQRGSVDLSSADLLGSDLVGAVPDVAVADDLPASADLSPSADFEAAPDLVGPCDGGDVIDGLCLAAYARVQSEKQTAGTGASSDTVKLAVDTQSGNLLVLAVGVLWDETVKPITVPTGWTLVEQRDNTKGTTAHETIAVYVYENAPSLAATTGVTVNNGDADARMYLALVEYAGFRTAGVVDQKISQAGSGNPISPGTTAMTTSDQEVWLSFAVGRSGVAHSAPTDDFTLIAALTTGAGAFSLGERVVASKGTATTTQEASGSDWAAALVTLRR